MLLRWPFFAVSTEVGGAFVAVEHHEVRPSSRWCWERARPGVLLLEVPRGHTECAQLCTS